MTGEAAGESLKAAWERLEAQFELAGGFWLGFVFCSSPQAVWELRGRAERLLSTLGELLIWLPAGDLQELQRTLPRLLTAPEPTLAACTWVEAIRSDSPGAPEQPWRRAWESLFLRANEHREALRARLKGGLVFAAPPEIKPLIRESAPDLWSIRALVIDLTLIDPPPLRSSPHHAKQRRASYRASSFDDGDGSEPWAPKVDAAQTDERPGRSSGTGEAARARRLLDTAEEHVAAGRTAEGGEAAAQARALSRGIDVLVETRAMFVLARADAALGHTDLALHHVQQAIDLRRTVAPGELPTEWITFAARLAKQSGDAARGVALYTEAASFYRARARDKETVVALMGLIWAVSGLGDLLRGEADLEGAATAFDEAVVVARRLCDLLGDLPDALIRLSAGLIKLADVRHQRGDISGALGNCEESLAVARRLHALGGDSVEGLRQMSVALTRVARLRREVGDLSGARAALQEALGLRRKLVALVADYQSLRDLISCLHHSGKLELIAGDVAAAKAALQEALGVRHVERVVRLRDELHAGSRASAYLDRDRIPPSPPTHGVASKVSLA